MDNDKIRPEKLENSGESGATESGKGESTGPSFDQVVRKMLNTPPKPKKGAPKAPATEKRDRRRVDR